MKNHRLSDQLQQEILSFLDQRRSVQLATLSAEGDLLASYAPFAIGDDCLYVLLSEIAQHANNLQDNPKASVLVVEDEGTANELFARVRVNYSVRAELIGVDAPEWGGIIDIMAARLGDRIHGLSQLADFKLFRLVPQKGRYVKGFGRAYAFTGESLVGEALDHLREGHRRREPDAVA